MSGQVSSNQVQNFQFERLSNLGKLSLSFAELGPLSQKELNPPKSEDPSPVVSDDANYPLIEGDDDFGPGDPEIYED